jgi:hypothetical protein
MKKKVLAILISAAVLILVLVETKYFYNKDIWILK